MKKYLPIVGAIVGWFAVVCQYYLIINNSESGLFETTVRFFCFFTILTNILLAAYFTVISIPGEFTLKQWLQTPGKLTAVTLYIVIVGLVYQFILRSTWHPEGLQKLVDELLHSVTPVLGLVYWFIAEKHALVKWKQIPQWLIYPLIYCVMILIRGSLANEYPYPFMDVATLGYSAVLINCVVLFVVFSFMAALLVGLGKIISR